MDVQDAGLSVVPIPVVENRAIKPKREALHVSMRQDTAENSTFDNHSE